MPPKTPPPAAAPTPRSFSWVSVLVGLIAVVAAGLAIVDPSEVLHLVSTFGGVSINATVPDVGVDCAQAEQFLTDAVPVKGFHVLCIKKGQAGETLGITAYKDGNAPAMTTQSSLEFGHLKTQLETLLDIEGPKDEVAIKYKQPYAFFTPEGKRLEELDQMVDQLVFLFEGGQFIWPGVRIGHKTVVKDVAGKGDVVLETLSLIPLVFSVEEFLKDEEIDVIMELSLEHLKPSTVTLMDGHENRAATDWRTSTTYFLSSEKHPVLDEIDQRVADLTKVSIDNQEDVQVLRYEETQKYDHHTDYFPVEHHKNSPHILESIDYGYKNRMITVFWYMSDVEKGGHTIFPRAGGAARPVSMKDCTHGLKVPPKKRKVIVFYSMLPNGEGDPMSLHGGCPVEDGVKYSGNKWVWNKARF
ncbi:putative prolyl 4-hydroxylase 4 [Phytophthora ramorum]|nr:putative prolyl 4-hydroxylase 4 [Phytophthora ramorum]